MSEKQSLRYRVYTQVDPGAPSAVKLSFFNKLVMIVVLLASLVAILITEPDFAEKYASKFYWFEIAVGIFFIIEYALRFWTAPEHHPKMNPWRVRAKFIFSPLALLDLLIIASIFTPLFLEGSTFLRILRVLRILALARLTLCSRAMHHLWEAMSDRRYDLGVTLGLSAMLMLFGATMLYWLEGDIQPEAFGSIPRSLWWAVITITTVGYGDAAPLTTAGRFVAAFVALSGVALVAMPTGILAAGFSDGMQRRQREFESEAENAAQDDDSSA